jgi:hypothetical protein
VIDGKELSWHEFGRMLMTYEGLHYKLEIFEGSEEKQDLQMSRKLTKEDDRLAQSGPTSASRGTG